PEDYLLEVAQRVDEYQGFNLLVGDGQSLWYLHGGAMTKTVEPSIPERLGPGIYGLSNAALDVPWPKVQRGREQLARVLAEQTAPTHAQLAACLSDRSLANKDTLLEQDLEGEMARQLSAQFIVTPRYGTRCCSTLRQQQDRLEFQEQRFDARGGLMGTEVFELETLACD
ncbi:MAG: NRDE family protein, partial [Congregibacter sp.]|nr:NRDE family protein [Congregibacter sp.]